MTAPVSVPCPCPFCTEDATPPHATPCLFCARLCIPLALQHRALADVTRWKLHQLARYAEEEGARPAVAFVPEMLRGAYAHACRMQLEVAELDRAFRRRCEDDRA